MDIETIKDIGAIFGCASAVFGFVLAISKTARGWIANLFKRKQEKLAEKQNEIRYQAKLDSLIKKWDEFITADAAFKTTIQDELETQKEFAKAECRATIKDIFYRYCIDKKIPLYEYKTAISTYEIYDKKLNGNSFASLLIEELKTWEIDYTHSFKEDDE